MLRRPPPLAVLLPFALTGCVAPGPKPVAAPAAPPPLIAAPPVRSADWRDWPLAPGTWTYAAGVARFGRPGQPADLVLRCDPAAGVLTLARAAPAASGPRTLQLAASDAARSLAAVDRADGATVSLAARDRFLDTLAFSRGRILVALGGAAPLVAPAWAEIGRVVEDCRS